MKWPLGIDKLVIHFDKTDVILGFIGAFLFALMDVAHNKVIDLGINHLSTVWGGVRVPAIAVWWACVTGIFIVALTFMLLRMRRRVKRGTHLQQALLGIDIVMGMLMALSLAPMIAGTLIMIYVPDTTPIPVFTSFVSAIEFYHIYGVAIGVLTLFYFTITE